MRTEKIVFECQGTRLTGILHSPADQNRGVVVVTGPLTSVKEQAAGAYAHAMAERGYRALAFDHRGFGESAGEPRQLESPARKADDVRAAIDALTRTFEPKSVFALGVCAGAGYMTAVAAQDPRVTAFAGVAGVYHDAAATRAAMGDSYEAALERAAVARDRRLATGEVTRAGCLGQAVNSELPRRAANLTHKLGVRRVVVSSSTKCATGHTKLSANDASKRLASETYFEGVGGDRFSLPLPGQPDGIPHTRTNATIISEVECVVGRPTAKGGSKGAPAS